MPKQNDANTGEGHPDEYAIDPLIKAYVDEQIQNVIPERPEAHKKKWKNAWRSASPITKGSFIMTAGIAVATIAYAIFAGWQLSTMSHTYTEIKSQTKAEQDAAYIACQSAQFSRNTIIENIRAESDAHESSNAAIMQAQVATQAERAFITVHFGDSEVGNGKPIAEEFHITNEGKTSAQNISFHGRLVLVRSDSDPDFTYPRKQTIWFKAPFLNAGQPYGITVKGKSISATVLDSEGNDVLGTHQDVEAARTGKADLIFYANYSYDDIFGVRHWAHLCDIRRFIEEGGPAMDVTHFKCWKYNQRDQNQAVSEQSKPFPETVVPPEVKCVAPPSE
jgi:hypothetical protein